MMTTRQFYFSSLTGTFLMALAVGLSSLDVAGGGLFLVGAGILALAVSYRLGDRIAPAMQRIAFVRRDNMAVLPEASGQ